MSANAVQTLLENEHVIGAGVFTEPEPSPRTWSATVKFPTSSPRNSELIAYAEGQLRARLERAAHRPLASVTFTWYAVLDTDAGPVPTPYNRAVKLGSALARHMVGLECRASGTEVAR